jgi:hypothetical protein
MDWGDGTLQMHLARRSFAQGRRRMTIFSVSLVAPQTRRHMVNGTDELRRTPRSEGSSDWPARPRRYDPPHSPLAVMRATQKLGAELQPD